MKAWMHACREVGWTMVDKMRFDESFSKKQLFNYLNVFFLQDANDILQQLYFIVGGTGPSSDSGWGCMLRSGQMILAEALLRRHLGRG